MRHCKAQALVRNAPRGIIAFAPPISFHPAEDPAMSKGMDQKKTEKKKPEKSLKEKRAAKKEKKAGK
jgi:hypothetical protein